MSKFSLKLNGFSYANQGKNYFSLAVAILWKPVVKMVIINTLLYTLSPPPPKKKKKKIRLPIWHFFFFTTQELFHLICSFKIKHKQNFIMHNLSGHSLKFTNIFISKTSALLNRVLGKKVALFFNRGNKALHCVYAVFCAGISMSHIEAL